MTRLSFVTITSVVIAVISQSVAYGDLDPAKVVIAPTPKEMRIAAGDALVSPGGTIVIDREDRTLRAAADWVNRRVTALGSDPLRVQIAGSSRGACVIAIGKPDGFARPYIAAHGIKISRTSPGPEGYVIRTVRDGDSTVVLLTGCDTVGAFYAAVSFCHLIHRAGDRLLAREAEIRDWPDWRWRSLAHLGLAKQLYLGEFNRDRERFYVRLREWLDRAAASKINMMQTDGEVFGWRGEVGDSHYQSVPAAKPIMEYARDRGISSFMWQSSCLAPVKGNENDPELSELMQLTGKYFCWSADDRLRRKFTNVAKFMSAAGVEYLAVHYPDTANENWQNRCSRCDKRFGGDRVLADANVTRIIYDSMNAVDPSLKLLVVVHPYGPSYLKHPYYVKFLSRLAPLIPKDIWICTREDTRERYEQFRAIYQDRPLFVYYQPFDVPRFPQDHSSFGRDYPLFPTNPRFAKTFHFAGSEGILHSIWWKTDFDRTVMAEFAWNADAPGSSTAFHRPQVILERDRDVPRAYHDAVTSRVARFLFGGEAGRMFAPLAKLQIFRQWIFQPELMVEHTRRRAQQCGMEPPTYDPLAVVTEQAANAKRGAEIAERILQAAPQFKDEHARKLFARYHKLVHLYARVAPARVAYLRSKKLLVDGKVEEAKAEAKRALAELENAKSAFKDDLARIAEWPQFARGAVPSGRSGHKSGTWWSDKNFDKYFAADLRWILEAAEQPELIAKEKEGVPQEVQERLARLAVRVTRTDTPPAIDGRLDDECWKAAPAQTDFVCALTTEDAPLVYPEAKTEARLLYDAKHLYVAFICQELDIDSLVGGQKDRDTNIFNDDVLEVFLDPKLTRKQYCQLACNIAGAKFDVVPKLMEWGWENITRWNPAWEMKVSISPERNEWTAEISIPFDAFRSKELHVIDAPPKPGDVWGINLARERRTIEYSCLMRTQSFHNVEHFPKLVFE